MKTDIQIAQEAVMVANCGGGRKDLDIREDELELIRKIQSKIFR